MVSPELQDSCLHTLRILLWNVRCNREGAYSAPSFGFTVSSAWLIRNRRSLATLKEMLMHDYILCYVGVEVKWALVSGYRPNSPVLKAKIVHCINYGCSNPSIFSHVY